MGKEYSPQNPEKPQYIHNSNFCQFKHTSHQFLGRYYEYDLYYCEDNKIVFIARFGNKSDNCLYGINNVWFAAWATEAYKRAIKLDLLSPELQESIKQMIETKNKEDGKLGY